MLRFAPFALLILLTACDKPSTVEDLYSANVVMPNGNIIHARTMSSQFDRARGLAFEKSLPPDRGMLFIHETPGKYRYWMYQHYIPLDMIWMDGGRSVVEIVENAQPCKTPASQCVYYGGAQDALYLLEVPGGTVQNYHLKVGDRLSW